MARKRKRKGRRGAKHQVPDPRQMLAQGWRKLEAGDPREALDHLKRARHRDGSLEGLDLALFCALSARARELAAGSAEGAAVRQRAAALQASIRAATLSELDLARYLRWLGGAEAVRVYAGLLGQRPPSDRAERVVADQLVAHRCWETVGAFDEEHPLRRDAGVVAGALAKMDEGSWDAAAAALGGITRRSPFVAWRVFCKGMACFGAGDGAGLVRALERLPEDFPLTRTVCELRRSRGGTGNGVEGPRRDRVRELLDLGGPTEDLARQLVTAVTRGRGRDVQRLLPELAKTLYPQDEASARVALVEVLSLAVGDDDRLGARLLRVLRKVLPADRGEAVVAKLAMRVPALTGDDSPALAAAAYCEHLEAEFPDEGARKLARACVLEYLAGSGQESLFEPRWLPPQSLAVLRELAGDPACDPNSLSCRLLQASLELDPQNREGHRRLVTMLGQGGASYRQVEQALIDVRDRFPDDPEPCLELASHYHARNAYRKAEAALAEARERAPHDERILDREAVGYLKSAGENVKRGKWNLAARDLGRAQALARRRVDLVLRAKWLVFDLLSGDEQDLPEAQLRLAIDPRQRVAPRDPEGPRLWERLDGLTPAVHLRVLALVLHELAGHRSVTTGSAAVVAVRAQLDEALDQAVAGDAGLSSAEVLALLSPVAEEFALLFADVGVARTLKHHWPELLRRLREEELVSAIDMLLHCKGHDEVRHELDRRLAESRGQRSRLLLFCLEVVRQLEGRSRGPRRFQELADAAGGAEAQQLRAAGRRLARYAFEPLRTALQRFEFGLLEPLPSLFEGGLFPFDDAPFPFAGGVPMWGDEDEEDDDFDDEDDGVDVVDMLEEVVDRAGARRQPVAVIRELACLLRTDPEMCEAVAAAATALEPVCQELSREVRILLYPERKDPWLDPTATR